MAPLPSGAGGLYYVLAAVGIFTLLVGAAVRTRRPFDQATLHFFWLGVAFFGTFTFSFTGRFDRVDWFFYWADNVAHRAACRRSSCISRWSFPNARTRAATPRSWRGGCRRSTCRRPCSISTRIVALLRAGVDPEYFVRLIGFLDQLELPHLTAFLAAGLRGAGARAAACALGHVDGGSCGGLCGARRSACCRSRSATRCRSRSACEPSLPMELSAIPLAFIPLAFASAIVRYRLMDVEVILKRLLVYTAVLAAIAAIYVVILRTSGGVVRAERG